ncbi:MAG: YcgN family cysteine cluster protein [Proteobacteria bacterium]|nr:YcgN family cysteine cluster protein [Pseudomonadota bacterium]
MAHSLGEGEAVDRFWEKPLSELNDSEWERLCDGCGRCCLKKLQDDDSGETHYTRVVCRYFESETSRCSCYDQRTALVPDCVNVKQVDASAFAWMPATCAYRLRFEDKPLYSWHPLIAGSRQAMERAEIPIVGRTLSEEFVHRDGYQEHIIRWVEC